MRSRTERSSTTASSARDAARGRATATGMGVTMPIQKPARVFKGNGVGITMRRDRPAALA